MINYDNRWYTNPLRFCGAWFSEISCPTSLSLRCLLRLACVAPQWRFHQLGVQSA